MLQSFELRLISYFGGLIVVLQPRRTLQLRPVFPHCSLTACVTSFQKGQRADTAAPLVGLGHKGVIRSPQKI